MSMVQEFKDFAMKGNVVDLAVGVVIGGAFGKIISSLVEFVITPFVGILMMGTNFSGLSFGIGEAQIKYGMFLQATLDFAIVATVVFLVVRGIKKAQEASAKKEKAVEEKVMASLTKDQELLEQIVTLLKKTK